jgi:CheY-like chemotaxis protein
MSRLLVVDDDPVTLALLVAMLAHGGHEVTTAPDGKTALGILERRGTVELLITDVVMPEMNGFNLAREARRRQPDLRVIYLTGYWGAPEMASDTMRFGNLLKKPILPSDLLREVERALSA